MSSYDTAPVIPHDRRIGDAYVAGIMAARQGEPITADPYYENTEEWVAYQSGWRDEMARQSSLSSLDG